MNYYLPKMSASIDNEHTSVTSSIGKLIEGTYNLQESEVPKLHRSFTSFYETRTAKTHKSNQNPRHKNAVEYSFKPHINESSVVLASGVKYKRSDSLGSYTKTEDYLLSDHIKIQEKLERKRKLQEKEDTKECTFKPKINEKPKFLTQKKENKDTLSEEYKKLSGELTHEHRSVALYSLSEAQRKRKSELLRKAEENEIEKTQSECTFTPKIEKKRVKDETDVLAKKGVTEAINRMKRAREEQALIRSLKERGFTNQGDLKPLNFSQESLQKSRSSITFSRPPLPAQNKPKEKRDSLKVLKDQENTQELASLQDCE